MAYLPDPTDATQPVASVKASTAAAEFRALKAYVAGLAGLTPITALPSLTLQELNSGQIAGMRNRVWNSGCRIAQRAAVPVALAYTQGAVDGYTLSLSGSGISGNFQQVASSLFTGTGLGVGVVGNWTSGSVSFRHRIEAKDTYALNGKVCTISCLVYHDVGSTLNYSLQITRPTTTPDDFSALTLIVASGSKACTTGVATRISHSFTFGATDCSNGLQLSVFATSGATAVAKTIAISELMLQEGSVVTPYEHVPFEVELARCQRYYELGNAYYEGYAVAAANPVGGSNLSFKVTKRIVPTITFGAFGNIANAAVGANRSLYVDSFERYALSIAAGVVTGRETWAASAEL